uniref:Uncharacterized protein n=1 Tax=Aegilops tauschii TaxID=37682 RepID=M8BXD3_AEGTA
MASSSAAVVAVLVVVLLGLGWPAAAETTACEGDRRSSAAVVAVVLVVLLGLGWPAAAETTACEGDCRMNCSSICTHNINAQASPWLDCTTSGPCGPPPDPGCVQACKSKALARCADARCNRQCAACHVSRQQCRETIDMFIGMCTDDCTTRCKRDCVAT